MIQRFIHCSFLYKILFFVIVSIQSKEQAILTIRIVYTWYVCVCVITDTYIYVYNARTLINQKKPPWSESASELYLPSDRRLSAK
jgi:hypothetical protein